MKVGKHLAIWTVNVVGFGTGLLLVLFGFYFEVGGSNPTDIKVVHEFAELIGPIVTFAGVIMVASSAWIPQTQREPDPLSKLITAPIMILICMALIAWIILDPSGISPHITNGIAICGITGAIMRLLPFTEYDGFAD